MAIMATATILAMVPVITPLNPLSLHLNPRLPTKRVGDMTEKGKNGAGIRNQV
jgi:hypothetical protein